LIAVNPNSARYYAETATISPRTAKPLAGFPHLHSMLGVQTIYCGDNLELLSRFRDESVDLIVFD